MEVYMSIGNDPISIKLGETTHKVDIQTLKNSVTTTMWGKRQVTVGNKKVDLNTLFKSITDTNQQLEAFKQLNAKPEGKYFEGGGTKRMQILNEILEKKYTNGNREELFKDPVKFKDALNEGYNVSVLKFKSKDEKITFNKQLSSAKMQLTPKMKYEQFQKDIKEYGNIEGILSNGKTSPQTLLKNLAHINADDLLPEAEFHYDIGKLYELQGRKIQESSGKLPSEWHLRGSGLDTAIRAKDTAVDYYTKALKKDNKSKSLTDEQRADINRFLQANKPHDI